MHSDSFGRVYAGLLSGLVRNNSKDALLLFLKMVVIEISNISAVSESIGVNRNYKWICQQREQIWFCAWEDVLEERKPELCDRGMIAVNISQDMLE